MVRRLVEMARIGMWAIPWIGVLGAVMAPRHERRRQTPEPELLVTSGMGFLIMAQQATCWTPGPALPGVALLSRCDRGR